MNRVLIPTALAPAARPPVSPIRQLDGETMGTRWCVRYAAEGDPATLRRGIERELERVTSQMSGWRAGSDLSRFNAMPAGAWQDLPPEFEIVLGCACAVAAATGGAFDPTVGPLVELWGFGPQPAAHAGPPPQDAIDAARVRVGWDRLAFAAGRVRQPGGCSLDLSGIAKGYAVDLVAAFLDGARVGSYLVEIGGELRGRGVKPDGAPWWVEIERPPGTGEDGRFLVALHGLAIATSGDYRRCFRHDGRQYGHTLDPRTGWPIDDAIASVTVLHDECLWADALATALAVLGPATGMEHASRHGIAALFVLRDDACGLREQLSPALAAMLD